MQQRRRAGDGGASAGGPAGGGGASAAGATDGGAEAAQADIAALDDKAIKKLSVAALKEALQLRGLDTEGLKPVLIARLEGCETTRRRGTKRRAEERSSTDDFDDVPTCPICMEFLRREIYQCADGHLICGGCKPSLAGNRCPSCRQSMGSIRNRGMEGMLEKVRMPCRFRDGGCAAVGVKSDLEAHAEVCDFNPSLRPCPLSTCAHKCKPEVMARHVADVHDEIVYKVGDAYAEFHIDISPLSEWEDGEDGEWDRLIQFEASPAIYMLRHRSVDGMFQILAAQVFGESSDDHMLRFKLPLARGRMSVDIYPVRAELTSPRYPSFDDWPIPISSAVQLPLSMIKIRKNREHGEERGELVYHLMASPR